MKRFFSIATLLVLTLHMPMSLAFCDTTTLSWQPNTDSDLGGYKIYYGTSSRVYQPPIPLGNVTSYTFTNLAEGNTYFFALTAVDTAGNESGYSVEVSKLIPDSQAPVVQISSPTSANNFTTTSPSVALAGTASDNVGVTQVSWTNSGGGSGTAIGTTNWFADITLAEGQNIITVTARDAAGNEANSTLTVTNSSSVEVDTIPPSIDVTYPTDKYNFSTSGTTLRLSGVAQDDHEVTKVSWACATAGSGVATGTTNWVADITLTSWKNDITVTAEDGAGNTTSVLLKVFCQKNK